MNTPTRVINLCLVPLICVLPLFGMAACTATEAAEMAADGVEVFQDNLAELPDNLRTAGPYIQDDMEVLWNRVAAGIEVAADEVYMSHPPRPLTEARQVRVKLISGESFEEVVKNATTVLTPEDLKDMPIPDLSTLNGILPFEIDLRACGDNLAEVLNSLDVGQVSAVLRSEAGYHLIQLVDREGTRVRIGHVLFQVDPATDEADAPPAEVMPEDLLDEAVEKLVEAIEEQ